MEDAAFQEELRRRLEAFRSEFTSYQQFDSEFGQNPYSPSEPMTELVKLGPGVLPVLLELGSSSDADERFFAIQGLCDLGPAMGDEGLALLEGLTSNERSGWLAVDAIEQVFPDVFWASRYFDHHEGLRTIVGRHERAGTLAPFIERLLGAADGEALNQAVDAIYRVREADDALVLALRKVMASEHAGARRHASFLLSEHPSMKGDASLIEAALLSERLTPALIDQFGAGPESLRMLEFLVRQEASEYLSLLLKRRREAGLSTPSELVRPLIERKLRHPKREWRYEQHDVHEGANCARYLGDPALIPALVDAVVPENGGYAWEPLCAALASFGAPALAAVDARAAQVTDPKVKERLGFMLGRLRKP